MSFQWHGRDNGELVWEQKIKRYYFISGQEVINTAPHGTYVKVHIGSRLKLTKAEANKYFTKGYVSVRSEQWNPTTKKWEYPEVRLTMGTIGMDIEKRELRQYECRPEDVAPPKRTRKKK